MGKDSDNGTRSSQRLDKPREQQGVQPASTGMGIDRRGLLATGPGETQYGVSGEGLPGTPDLRPDHHSAGDSPSIQAILERVRRDASLPPPVDLVASKKWPILQECLRVVRTKEDKPRAGGELRLVASGSNYRLTLIMPEEGVQVTCVTNALSKSWDELEMTLQLEPVPWVECSDYALKRARRRNDKEEKRS